MRSRKSNALLGGIGLLALVSSFVFPGVRLGGVPVSFPLLASLCFLPLAPSAYGRGRWRLAVSAFCLLSALMIVNAILYGIEVRNILYLLIPLGAIGASALMKCTVDHFGLKRVQSWVLWVCGLNIAVMLMQTFNVFNVNDGLSALWVAGIDFVAATEEERNILLLTLPIRPPGMFPTGIFVSTALYVASRAIFVYQRKAWPLIVALLAIILSANRTLGLLFILFEAIAFGSEYGFRRLISRASVVALFCVVVLFVLAQSNVDLYIFSFWRDEVVSGEVQSSASVQVRLETLQLFLDNVARYGLSGGFSASALVDADHVFDSEILLRTLQFGVLGVGCLGAIILVPRAGPRNSSWVFLFVLALFVSLTATFMTSVVYAMVIAFYKESLVRSSPRGNSRRVSVARAFRLSVRAKLAASGSHA
jgi:hypothetical protein